MEIFREDVGTMVVRIVPRVTGDVTGAGTITMVGAPPQDEIIETHTVEAQIEGTCTTFLLFIALQILIFLQDCTNNLKFRVVLYDKTSWERHHYPMN